MRWLAWILLVAGLIALFVLWDLIFCRGERCKGFMDRIELPRQIRTRLR